MSQINDAILYIADPTKSRALFNAKLYFGLVDTDPTIAANQKLVRAVQENGSLVSLTQPVATNSGGNPTYNNSPVVLDISGNYSFQVNDRFDAKQYYISTVDNEEDGSDGFSGVVAIESNTLAAAQTTVVLANLGANESVFYLRTTIGDQGFLAITDDYTVTNSTTIELNQSYNAGDKIIARQNDPTGQLIPVNSAATLLVYPDLAAAQAAAVSGELESGDTVTLNGRDADGDGLGVDKAKVQVTGPSNDDVNFFDLNTTLQLATQPNYYQLLNYSETIGLPVISVGVLNVDLDKGSVHNITLTESVTGPQFANFNPNSDYASTVTLRLVQDGTGSWGVTWDASIKWPGGAAPTLTVAAGSIDEFMFTTYDAGATWSGKSIGQDIK